MATNPSSYSETPFPGSIGVEDLSIAVISPNENHRQEALHALSGCGGAYVSEFSTIQLQGDDGDTYYIAVVHQKSPWRNLATYQEQRYAIAVEHLDEGEQFIDLYNLVRARIQGRIRQRLR